MSEGIPSERSEARRYEIRLKGHLDRRWAAWFDGLNLSLQSDGTTVIQGPVADQAALHGLLQRVRDVGLPVVSVICVEPDEPDGPVNQPRQAPMNERIGDRLV